MNNLSLQTCGRGVKKRNFSISWKADLFLSCLPNSDRERKSNCAYMIHDCTLIFVGYVCRVSLNLEFCLSRDQCQFSLAPQKISP